MINSYAVLIRTYESKLEAANGRHDRAKAEAERIVSLAGSESRATLTEAENRRSDELFTAMDNARAEARDAQAALDALKSAQAEDAEADKLSRQVHATDAGKRMSGLTVTERASDGRVTGDRVDDSPQWRRNDGRPAAVKRDERMADHDVVREMASRDPNRATLDNYSGVGQLVRSLSTTGSSAIVPTIWAGNIIDRARNAAQVVNAGAEFLPMDSKILQIGRLTVDPVPAWLAEGGTRTGSDPTFDSVTLTARTLSCLTVASLEFLQDAVDADQVVEEAIGKAMGLAIDLAALFGGVTVGADAVAAGTVASPPSPLGILGNLLANASTSVLGSGANGTAITAATPWNELLTTYFTPQTYNEQPTAVLMNAKMAQKYAMTYDTLGQPLRPPPVMADIPTLITNQIPSFTQGTMTSIATDIFAGDFRQVLIGNRMDVSVQVLTERYAELGQVGILSTFRGDVVLARPRAMCVYRYIGGM